MGEGMNRPASLKGFTLIEVLIAATIFSTLSVLFLMMMSNALAVSEREGTINRMDLEANRALQEIATTLRRAVLPVVTDTRSGAHYPKFVYDPDEVDENGMPPKRSFQKLLNSEDGFRLYGQAWFTLLAGGTDFVPFTVPVDFGGDGDTIDSNFLPELGIILPSGAHVPAANYVTTPANPPVPALNELRTQPAHPYMLNMAPTDFQITVGENPIDVDESTNPRFARTLAFPGGMNRAFAVLRFVPTDDDNGNPLVINEADLLSGDGYDLNGNGASQDSFALGSLQVAYATDTPTATWIIGPMVLMQLNTNGVGYKPLFRLVNFQNPANAPNSLVYDGTTPIINGGYAILVNLLVLDWNGQQNTIAFNRRSGVPYIVRQYETLVELRNMSLP